MKSLPVDELIKRYNAGESLADLAKAFGVAGDTIRLRLASSGIAIRNFKEGCAMEAARLKVKESRTGSLPWNKGLTIADPRVTYGRKGRIITPEQRLKMSRARQKHPWFSACTECKRTKGFNRSRLCSFCAAKFRAENYPNAMLGTKMTEEHKLLMLNGQLKMTRPEKRCAELLDGIFGRYSPWRYVGSGEEKFFIRLAEGRLKRPDFVRKDEKSVIEVFGRYWHKAEEEDILKVLYKAAGWSCLILWEDELGPQAIDRIYEFTYPAEYWFEFYEANRVS